MRMEREIAVAIAAVVTLAARVGMSQAGVISIPNASFESPTVPNVSPYATSTISDWQKAPVPSWWLDAGYLEQQWFEAAGTFLNIPAAPIDNMDQAQAAFMFATPGVELFQDLPAQFEVGQSYHLTAGIVGGGYGMKLGVPMELRLYYRDDSGARVTVGSTTVTNTNDTGLLSHLTDFPLGVPEVVAGDPWAGKNIGVQLISTVGFQDAGGYWDLDNVRLTAVPEPASLAVAAFGIGALLLQRRRA
jgi:hypothetical protein